jgi:HD-GYP domain-containing protein (c-di-GMP phosphodiesterase class II)
MTDPNLSERKGGPAPGARHKAIGESGGGGARGLPLPSVAKLRQEGGDASGGPLPAAASRGRDGSLSTAHNIRLAVSELKIGMFVSELDRPWLESPFGFQGFPLRSVEDIQAVKRVCAYVYVDTEKSVGGGIRKRATPPSLSVRPETVQYAAPSAGPKRARSWIPSVLRGRSKSGDSTAAIIHSLDIAGRAYDNTSKQVRAIMRDLRWGRSMDVPPTKEAVAACAEQVMRDSGAMALLASIKDKDHYTAQHSLNVAILSMVLGHHLGLPHRALTDLGIAGLLHDVGKLLTPREILAKPGRLTPAEFRVIRLHPAHGKGILDGYEGVGKAAAEVAFTHHERLDGSGYPRGIKEGDMGLVTRIVAITDTYDAVTSDRVYSEAKTGIEAFKVLQAASGNHYDGQLVSELIGAVGLFPPGSTVQLNNGKYAIVVRTNQKYEFRPTVLIVKDAKNRSVRPRCVDLADVAGGASASFQIAKVLRPSDCGIDSTIFRHQDFLEAATA